MNLSMKQKLSQEHRAHTGDCQQGEVWGRGGWY